MHVGWLAPARPHLRIGGPVGATNWLRWLVGPALWALAAGAPIDQPTVGAVATAHYGARLRLFGRPLVVVAAFGGRHLGLVLARADKRRPLGGPQHGEQGARNKDKRRRVSHRWLEALDWQTVCLFVCKSA